MGVRVGAELPVSGICDYEQQVVRPPQIHRTHITSTCGVSVHKPELTLAVALVAVFDQDGQGLPGQRAWRLNVENDILKKVVAIGGDCSLGRPVAVVAEMARCQVLVHAGACRQQLGFNVRSGAAACTRGCEGAPLHRLINKRRHEVGKIVLAA